VPSGSIYGFLGPNGSGKTTTIRLCLGLLRAGRGTIHVLGHAIPRDTYRMFARVGYVPERPHLYRALTVRETLDYHAAFHARWDAAGAVELMRSFELPAETPVNRLSKGETGKLLMLLALAQRPDLLVLDEPTDGLDPVARRDVLMALIDFVSESGATVFISSHLVHELEHR
jgi:ABC-2 type transport system ATP-binding protein